MKNQVLDMSKSTWEFCEYPDDIRSMDQLNQQQWYGAKMPFTIFSSLMESGQIERDAFYDSPEDYQYVSEKSWVYRTSFEVLGSALEDNPQVSLVFQELDTYGTVWLNGRIIKKTENAFIDHSIDVTGKVIKGINSVMVKFSPSKDVASQAMAKYTVFSGKEFVNPYRAYARKMQSSFGWDFCPNLAGAGLAGARVEFKRALEIADIHARTIECNQYFADIKVTVELSDEPQEELLLELAITNGLEPIEAQVKIDKGQKRAIVLLHIDRPFLWWPKGRGVQHLYILDTKLGAAGETLCERQIKFGLRLAKLDRDDKGGFEFYINDSSVKIRGIDWSPSWLAEPVDYAKQEKLLKMLVSSGFNLVRVKGSGRYENDRFYELCDVLGIMVWQDFMFARGQYPDRDYFDKEIETEAIKVIKRLRNYSCIVLWCGNDCCQDMYKKRLLGKGRKYQGSHIFERLLPKLIEEHDGDRDYIETTPSLAIKADLSCENMRNFPSQLVISPLPQSFINSIHAISSYEFEKHNYKLDGNSEVYKNTLDTFPCDSSKMVYYSQLGQARTAKLFFENVRFHGKSSIVEMYNDCFPVISNSIVGYNCVPKAIYYYAKRFNGQTLIALTDEREIFVANDTGKALTGTICCKLLSFAGQLCDKMEYPVSLLPFRCSTAMRVPIQFFETKNRRDRYIKLELISDENITAQNIYTLERDKYLNLSKPNISYNLSAQSDSIWQLEITSDRFAKDVFVDIECEAILSDNFIDIEAGSSRIITVECNKNIKNKIKVVSVN